MENFLKMVQNGPCSVKVDKRISKVMEFYDLLMKLNEKEKRTIIRYLDNKIPHYEIENKYNEIVIRLLAGYLDLGEVDQDEAIHYFARMLNEVRQEIEDEEAYERKEY